MKKQLMLVLALVALSFTAARAQYQQPPPQVNVSGSAEVNVAPDEVYISAGVETRDAQLEVATRQNDERVASALAFLKDAGVPEKDIQTDSIEVQPDYGSSDTQIEPRFYKVRKSIGIKLTAITNLESVVTGLMSHGANVLDGVDLRTTELRKYRDQARAMAIKAAKEKAVALCGELDVKCGKPLSINAQEFGGYYNWPGNRWGWRNNGMSSYMNSSQNVIQNNDGGPDAAGETVSIGQISVSATVNVSFSIQ
jgi:uncharacterized protein